MALPPFDRVPADQLVGLTGLNSSATPTYYVNADSNGNLLVKDYSAGPVSPGTAALTSLLIGGVYNSSGVTLTNSQQSSIQLDSSGRVYTNAAVNAPPTNLLATGTLTGTGQTVSLTLQGTASINIDVSGPGFVGTLTVLENTPSGARNLGVFALNSSAVASSITANGNYRVVGIPTGPTVIVQFSAYTSGTATVNIYGSTAPYIVQPYSANAANVLVTSYLNDGNGNSITSTAINSKQRLDINAPSEGADGSTAPFYSMQVAGKDGSGNLQALLTDTLGNQAILVKDSSGNGINSYNSQLDTADIINSGLSSGSLTVGTTAVAARVGASNLSNRKMLMISPVTYTVYMGSSSSVTTANGIPIYPGQVVSFAFSANVTPYLIAATSGTVNIFEAS